jgi:hypothetical protein
MSERPAEAVVDPECHVVDPLFDVWRKTVVPRRPPADEWFNSVHLWGRNRDGNEEMHRQIDDEVRRITANCRARGGAAATAFARRSFPRILPPDFLAARERQPRVVGM